MCMPIVWNLQRSVLSVCNGRHSRVPLQIILVQRLFQKFGMDVMEILCTEYGNRCVVVFRDMWPIWFMQPLTRRQPRWQDFWLKSSFLSLEYQGIC